MFRRALLIALGCTIAVPGAAQVTSIQSPNPLPKGKNPNRIIWERQEVLGSRLGGKKVCKTALEWQQQRQEQRESVEKIQQVVGQKPST